MSFRALEILSILRQVKVETKLSLRQALFVTGLSSMDLLRLLEILRVLEGLTLYRRRLRDNATTVCSTAVLVLRAHRNCLRQRLQPVATAGCSAAVLVSRAHRNCLRQRLREAATEACSETVRTYLLSKYISQLGEHKQVPGLVMYPPQEHSTSRVPSQMSFQRIEYPLVGLL